MVQASRKMKPPVGVKELPYSPSVFLFFGGITPSPRGGLPLAFPIRAGLTPCPSGGLPSAWPLCQAFGSSALLLVKHALVEERIQREARLRKVLKCPFFVISVVYVTFGIKL